MLANRTSRWTIGAALLCVALLAASWFLLITPRRADASTVRVQVAQSDAKASQLRVQIAELQAQFAGLPKQQAELKAIKAQLPPTADIPALVRDLQSLAAQSGVSLDSLAPSMPVVVSPAGSLAPAVVGPGTVVSVPITVTVTGDYFEASLFVKDIQTKIQRSYLVSAISVAASQESVTTGATPTAVATTVAATGTATPTPTVSGSPAPAALNQVTLVVTGSIFVLMDGTTTLADVTKAAMAAGLSKTPTGQTPTSGATTAPLAATGAGKTS